jgi:hypothetical protein
MDGFYAGVFTTIEELRIHHIRLILQSLQKFKSKTPWSTTKFIKPAKLY